MTKLGSLTKKLNMPSGTADDPAWIEVKAAIYPLDILDLKEFKDDQYGMFCKLAERIIVKWNYTDVDGNAIPVITEWIDRLPIEDKKALSNYVTILFDDSIEGVADAEKKTLSSPSMETPTPASPPSI